MTIIVKVAFLKSQEIHSSKSINYDKNIAQYSYKSIV